MVIYCIISYVLCIMMVYKGQKNIILIKSDEIHYISSHSLASGPGPRPYGLGFFFQAKITKFSNFCKNNISDHQSLGFKPPQELVMMHLAPLSLVQKVSSCIFKKSPSGRQKERFFSGADSTKRGFLGAIPLHMKESLGTKRCF